MITDPAYLFSNDFATMPEEKPAYDTVKSLTRGQLLVQKQRKEQCLDQMHFVTRYSSKENEIKQTIKRNWDILKSEISLK